MARGGSKGLKGKNLKLLNGKPLIAYSIEDAIKSGVCDNIIIDDIVSGENLVTSEGKTIVSELYKFLIILKCFLLNSTIYNNENYGLLIIKKNP